MRKRKVYKFAAESLQKSISKLVTVSKAVSINIPLVDLLWGKGKKAKNKKKEKSRVTSSFFNRETGVIEADLISIAETRRRRGGGCGTNRENRKFVKTVRVFE